MADGLTRKRHERRPAGPADGNLSALELELEILHDDLRGIEVTLNVLGMNLRMIEVSLNQRVAMTSAHHDELVNHLHDQHEAVLSRLNALLNALAPRRSPDESAQSE